MPRNDAPLLTAPLATPAPEGPGGPGAYPDLARGATAFAIIAAGVELGLLANGLLRAQWGVNLLLWAAALAGAVIWLAHTRRRDIGDEPVLLAMIAVVFAGGLAVRDTGLLSVLNVFAMLGAFALAAMVVCGGPAGSVAGARLRDYAHATARAGWTAAFGGFPLLLRDARVQSWSGSSRSRQAFGILRGVLIAAPLLIVFGSLFMAADAAFDKLVMRLIGFDFETLASHAAVVVIFAWLSAGYLHGMLLAAPPRPIAAGGDLSIGATETGVALTLLNLLFAAFVVVQMQYLFGGTAVVEQTAGLTYAEYARRGFFELTLVTALVVPVLLCAGLLMRRERPSHERMFRALAGTLTVLVGLIMISAVHRMRLYQDAYGLTESRFYASAFMAWIAIVLGWFAWTVLRGRSHRFAAGALIAAAGMLGALNIANPDHFIARVNLDRARAGAQFDLAYASRLSGDAVPVVMEALRTLPPSLLAFTNVDGMDAATADWNRCMVRDQLRRWTVPQSGDWRSWNLGRARAREAASANRALIDSIDCDQTVRPDAPRPSKPGEAVAP